MKTGIHPAYNIAQVSCACGNTFTTRSIKPVIKTEICSACHPFFTGTQKFLDTAGRVERFAKRFAKTDGKMVAKAPTIKTTKAPIASAVKPQKIKTLTTAPKKSKEKDSKTAKK